MRLVQRISFLVMFLLIAVAPVLAQEGENSPADTPTGWAVRWLSSAIVFGAIGYCAVKFGGPVFRATAEETAKKIEEGARAREEAEKQKKEIEAKLANLPKEIEAMKAEAKRDTAAEGQGLRDPGAEKGEKHEKRRLR